MATATVATAIYGTTATAGLRNVRHVMGKEPQPPFNPTVTDRRVAAHIEQLVETRFRSPYNLALEIGIPPNSLTKPLNGTRGFGLKVILALHDGVQGLSLDQLLDDNPPAKYWKIGAGEVPARGREPLPRLAARRRKEGRKREPDQKTGSEHIHSRATGHGSSR